MSSTQMSLQTDQEGPWASLNGQRIPIALFLTLSGLLVTMWADLRDLKARVANSISESRVAVLEEQVRQMRQEMAKSDDHLRNADERSRQDRERMWDQIERMGGHRR